MPSFRDNLKFSASMIDPNAMNTELENLQEDGGYTMPDDNTPAAIKKAGKWGWWALVAPFIL
jgi:hypothetical protein